MARKAIDRKTGARGLRSIMEAILLDSMFELPSLKGVEEVVISPEVIEGNAKPLRIYAERLDEFECVTVRLASQAKPSVQVSSRLF